MFRNALAALGLLAASVAPAAAATFSFQYDIASTGGTLTGFFEGEENTPGFLDITDVFGVELDGVEQPEVVQLDQAFVPVEQTTGLIATDLSSLNVVACFNESCLAGFVFYRTVPGLTDFFEFIEFDGSRIADVPLNTGGFTLVEATTPIPLPASGLMLLAALAGGAVALRRRSA